MNIVNNNTTKGLTSRYVFGIILLCISLLLIQYKMIRSDNMPKTNTGLVEYAEAQLGKPYWYGCYGNIATESLYASKKKQYPSFYTATDYKSQYGQKVHDCIGLIKGYLWSDTPISKPQYNASQDVSADGMLAKCKEKGNISTIPELPGVLVFSPQHVGVYIGNGYVIEARGHAYGVVKTKLSLRGWKSWGKCPWIEYIEEDQTKQATSKENLILSFQKAALADDNTLLPKYGADGDYGNETAEAMKKCVVKKRETYQYKNCTKLVQRLLGIKQDGLCGAQTANAIKNFQQKNGLVADSCCGLKTWQKLLGIN